MMTSESRGRSRKHKLFGDTQDITSDGTCSNRACNSWEESDDINSYFCHQLSTLSIPKSAEHPPRKKLKRRKNRKVKRTRVSRPTVHISESSDVTPTSPGSSQVISVASDDTVQEAMSVGDASSDSSLSLGHITDLGGTDADDELSCWEGPCFQRSSEDDMEMADSSAGLQARNKKRVVRIDTDLQTGTVPEMRGPQSPLKTLVRREKLKTRHKTQAAREHGGSSTSSPSMTGIDSAMKRRYIGMEFSIGDGAGPSSAMHIGD